MDGSEICFNGIDDDSDGFVDCNDYDCSQIPIHPACRLTEICDNGRDDDEDGKVDCDDFDCTGVPVHPACE